MKTVLIVEDEKLIRQGIKSMVQRSGVPVEVILECSNGQMALEILKEQPVDVMFTDIRMPKMDGIGLVKAMQQLDHIPITVAISGYDDFSYAVEMMRYGAREYILKPVDRDRIREILEKLNLEIEESLQKDREIRSISYQQLKYFILNENMGPQELQAMENRLHKLFYPGAYVIYCMEAKTDEACHDEGQKPADYIWLEQFEGQQLFIVETEKCEAFENNHLPCGFVGRSLPHQGLSELRQAYCESLHARKRAFLKEHRLVSYSREKKSGIQPVDTNKIHQIVQMLATDKIDDACRIFDKIVWEVRCEQLNVDSFAENMGIMLDCIWSTYQNVLEIDNSALSGYRNIFAWPSLEAFKTDFVGWMMNFHNRIHTEFDDYKNKHKLQQAVEYIQEHYAQDLSMTVISNMISMNYSLFSYEFKQYTGSNFVNYVRDIRINEAKRLLSETDLRITEISRRVGYNNDKHFMKLFKSVCGVSPTEYRKNQCYSG